MAEQSGIFLWLAAFYGWCCWRSMGVVGVLWLVLLAFYCGVGVLLLVTVGVLRLAFYIWRCMVGVGGVVRLALVSFLQLATAHKATGLIWNFPAFALSWATTVNIL